MDAEEEREGIATVWESPIGGSGRLASVCLLFLRLSATAFGGPAVYIAMMRDEVVSRRRWLTDAHFLDLLGATNLIPCPNAAEMAIYIGRVRAGWPGLILAGLCFTAPATAITLAFAWSYVRFGSTPELSWVLYGVKPVVIGLMLQAIWSLGRQMTSRPLLPLLGGCLLALYFLGVNEIALLFGAGLAVVLGSHLSHLRARCLIPAFALPGLPWLAGAGVSGAASFSLGVLFLTFLKIGCILYGSGYVLVAFLRADFVDRLGWLTEQQLLDAVAAGQVTPGPLLSTVTFIGYILGQLAGCASGNRWRLPAGVPLSRCHGPADPAPPPRVLDSRPAGRRERWGACPDGRRHLAARPDGDRGRAERGPRCRRGDPPAQVACEPDVAGPAGCRLGFSDKGGRMMGAETGWRTTPSYSETRDALSDG
jgi:chromate transporter